MKDIVEFLKGFDWHNVITIGAAFLWLHGDIQEVKKDLQQVRMQVENIKTVLITKGIMPECFAKDVKPLDNESP